MSRVSRVTTELDNARRMFRGLASRITRPVFLGLFALLSLVFAPGAARADCWTDGAFPSAIASGQFTSGMSESVAGCSDNSYGMDKFTFLSNYPTQNDMANYISPPDYNAVVFATDHNATSIWTTYATGVNFSQQ